MRKLMILSLLIDLFAACGCGRRPTNAVSLDSADSVARGISGMTMSADGDKLLPFLLGGQLRYERERKVSDSVGHLLRTDHLIYDGRGRIVGEVPPADSAGHFLPSFEAYLLRYTQNPDFVLDRKFYGELDLAGRLIYRYKFIDDKGLLFYDPTDYNYKPTHAVEFFSLSALRRDAEKDWHSFSVGSGLRERLERAGCFLPEDQRPPERPLGLLHPNPADYEGLNQDRKVYKEFVLAWDVAEQSGKAFVQELNSHLDSLLPKYEREIERFIADNRSDAYIYGEYVVLPRKGFAFEPTPGMNLPDLPSVVAEPLPQWDKMRRNVVLRRMGIKRRLRFAPIAYIPRWIIETEYYYKLTVDDRMWFVHSADRLRVLDSREANGETHFSLIDKAGRARLFVAGKSL